MSTIHLALAWLAMIIAATTVHAQMGFNTSMFIKAQTPMSCGDSIANNCYSGSGAASLKNTGSVTTPLGKSLTWNSVAQVWVEAGAGTRVLAADGSDNWAYQLNGDGGSYSAYFLDKANVAGRVCPTNVFVPGNLVATGKCLYYDGGNAAQWLDAPNNDGVTTQSAGAYRLGGWATSAGGNGTGPSWYEGNIQTCANKGMRLPILYETTATDPGNNKPSDASPTGWGNGVPNVSGTYSYTSSSLTTNSNSYWVWNNTSSYWYSYAEWNITIRCVAPAEAAYTVTYAANGATSGTAPPPTAHVAGQTVTTKANNGTVLPLYGSYTTYLPTSAATATQLISNTLANVAFINSSHISAIMNGNAILGDYNAQIISSSWNTSVAGQVSFYAGILNDGYTKVVGIVLKNNAAGITAYQFAAKYWTGDVLNSSGWTATGGIPSGGTDTPNLGSSTYGVRSLTANVNFVGGDPLVRTDYTFAGWNTAADGSGSTYAAGSATFIMDSNDITLYARWTPAVTCGSSVADNCYTGTNANAAKTNVYANTPSGKSLVYDSTTGIWSENGGSRVLATDGTDNWAYQLNGHGRSYNTTLFLDKANVAGRVCPTNVFVPGNLVATGKCLYYDSGNVAQRLDAPTNYGFTTQSINIYRLGNWDTTVGGNATAASWYEGNIQTCAAKGMRLPTLYETTATDPANSGNGGYKPTDAAPTGWGNGVPDLAGAFTWTSSATTYGNAGYWLWTGTSINASTAYTYAGAVRCVAPGEALYSVTYNANGSTSGTAPSGSFYPTGESFTVASISADGDGLARLDQGRPYSLSPTPNSPTISTYDDKNEMELTNGSTLDYACGSIECTVGWASTSPTITVDLGSVREVAKARIFVGGSGTWGIYAPSQVQILLSIDGTNYTEVATANPPEAQGWIEQSFATTPARYVRWKLTYRGEWTMVGEVEAYGPMIRRTGYSFAGWNTAADGSGTNYAAGSGSVTMSSANRTLYAKWIPTLD